MLILYDAGKTDNFTDTSGLRDIYDIAHLTVPPGICPYGHLEVLDAKLRLAKMRA